MSILGKGLKRIKDFNVGVRSKRIRGLLEDTARTERGFVSEAKRLGIEAGDLNLRSYYEALGLKYTNDNKAIRESYVRLVKQYHPDVSSNSGATQKTEEINEAYAVLKDRQKKAEYDAKFSKGRSRMSSDTAKILYNELLKQYQKARSKDFDDFNKRVANPHDINSLKATVEETVNWTKRFRQVSNITFGKFWDYGRKLKHLEYVNKSLIRGEERESNLDELNSNLVRLESMIYTFNEAEKGISAAIENAMNDIATEENNLAGRLRRSVN
jgi:DnaJ-domain-containing protein 1